MTEIMVHMQVHVKAFKKLEMFLIFLGQNLPVLTLSLFTNSELKTRHRLAWNVLRKCLRI